MTDKRNFLVKFSPFAFNLQDTEYITITNPDMKEQLYYVANERYKVKSSSSVIIVLVDKKAYKNASNIFIGLKQLGILSEQEYEL